MPPAASSTAPLSDAGCTTATPTAAAGSGRGPYLLGRLLVAATLLLIGLGAMVTSTGSGMAFEDWPLANGSLWPGSMNLPELLEHGHRVFASLVGLMTVALAVWIWRAERRRWLHKLGVAAVVLVIVQGVVGGLGVLKNLPAYTSIAHGVLPQIFVGTIGLIAFALSPTWRQQVAAPPGAVGVARRLSLSVLLLIPVQTFLGASLRHTDQAPYLWLHTGFAFVVALAALVAAFYCGERLPRELRFKRTTSWVLAILGTQVVLGFVALAARQPKDPSNVEQLGRAVLVSLHVVVGAALFLALTVLVCRAWRNLLPDASAAAGGVRR